MKDLPELMSSGSFLSGILSVPVGTSPRKEVVLVEELNCIHFIVILELQNVV